jgi:ATP-dependent Lon protease
MNGNGGSKKGGVKKLITVLREKALALDPRLSEQRGLSAESFPLLPLQELVLFPQTVIPLFVTCKSGVMAVEEALKRDNRLFASCVKRREGGKRGSENESNLISRIHNLLTSAKGQWAIP